jgi:hypothetical protein
LGSKNTTIVFSRVNTIVVLFFAGNKKPAEAGYNGILLWRFVMGSSENKSGFVIAVGQVGVDIRRCPARRVLARWSVAAREVGFSERRIFSQDQLAQLAASGLIKIQVG